MEAAANKSKSAELYITRSHGNSPTHSSTSAGLLSNWQALDMQLFAADANRPDLGSATAGVLPMKATASPELLGSTMMSNDWQQLLDANSRFTNSLPPVSHRLQTGSRGIMEGARIRELIAGRSGASLGSSCYPAQKITSSWDAANITVDPSKGGLALQGVGVATSHCLAQFTSDPAFAERAANFSPFSGGIYSHVSQPLPVNNITKQRPRSAEIDGKLLKPFASCHGTASARKLAPAVASELEEKYVRASAASEVVVEALADDESLPRSTEGSQPELEAVEGATDADMDFHEAEVTGQENSSCSEEVRRRGGSSPVASPARSDDSAPNKRKSTPDQDVSHKVAESEETRPKRYKAEESRAEKGEVKPKTERCSSENSGESGSRRTFKENQKLSEPSKQDYIHVRARRGQATDSHSLAERVRREKISERMKYLQDLVPGCSKVTGKAVMLDEIINYVQSLQRQVEHLSMKLASVNPGRLDFNLESVLSSKEMLQSRLSSFLAGPEISSTFGLLQQQQMPMLGGHCGLDFRSMGTGMQDVHLRRTISAPITGPSCSTAGDVFCDDVSQTSIGWDGDLQSVVQMGFGHQGRVPFLESLNCQLTTGHMKVEL